MDYFPLFFDLQGQRVLVVGAGAVALRKVQLLARAHAAIVVVAPVIAPELVQLASTGAIEPLDRMPVRSPRDTGQRGG